MDHLRRFFRVGPEAEIFEQFQRWNLLGPMTAMNGVLLFGWSTEVIFEVLRMTLLAGDEGDLQKREWPK